MRKIVIMSVLLMVLISMVIYAEEAIIVGDNVNVRSGPGTEYDVIHQVHSSETYTVMEQNEEWSKISFPQGEGWVHNDFVEKMKIEDETETNENPSSDLKNDQISTQVEDEGEGNPDILMSSLAGKVIVLDPGHGGRDVGAIGVSGKVESEYTLQTVQILKGVLEQHGAIVLLTRESDQYVPLTSRSSRSNIENADIFISIHYNSTPEHPTANGIGTYYYHDRDHHLANYVQKGLMETTNLEDRGVHQGNLQVLRINHSPGLLLELGFISNQQEEETIQSHIFLKEASRGIVQGLYQYFSAVE